MNNATTKCEAKTTDGKRCFFLASAEVGGHKFCGNHAAKARQTRFMDKPSPSPTSDYTGRDVLDAVRNLQQANTPDYIIVQVLDAWKAGAV
jgi:hypothetical protein